MSTTTSTNTELEPLVLHFSPVLKKMSEEEFYEFCRLNPDLSLELTSEGDLIIMPPTGGKTGKQISVSVRLGNWAEPSTVETSSSPSASCRAARSVRPIPVGRNDDGPPRPNRSRTLPTLCPDFVVELRSRTDSLKNLRQKMDEYMANGAQLGWLIDPLERKVHVYRPSAPVEELDNPQTISGEPLLNGLELDLQEIWD